MNLVRMSLFMIAINQGLDTVSKEKSSAKKKKKKKKKKNTHNMLCL